MISAQDQRCKAHELSQGAVLELIVQVGIHTKLMLATALNMDGGWRRLKLEDGYDDDNIVLLTALEDMRLDDGVWCVASQYQDVVALRCNS